LIDDTVDREDTLKELQTTIEVSRDECRMLKAKSEDLQKHLTDLQNDQAFHGSEPANRPSQYNPRE
jgi:hypothetical protein